MATSEPAAATEAGRDFIRDIVQADLDAKRATGVVTRFPPEPNGYLHIGHAKSICLNFGVAEEFGGRCHLRYDDTNPTREEQEYIDAIERDVRWLGYDWGEHLHHASDYFGQLYDWADHLIRAGKAYVDDQSPEEMRLARGTLTGPGRDSPFRNRSVAENPHGEFHFEMGRVLAERLGYPSADLDRVPAEAIESFAGVGYYFHLAALAPGETVVDLGSGSGMDTFVAALAVGPRGRVIGIDMTDAQRAKAERLRDRDGFRNVTYLEGYIEAVPLPDGCADVVISNGVINLAPDKGAVFGEGAPPDSGAARQIAQRASRGLARIREAAGGRFAELVVGDVHGLRDVEYDEVVVGRA